MSSDPPIPLTAYLGIIELTFERGAYHRVMEWANEALTHYPAAGTLKLWQALALEAMGRTAEAIALTRPLLKYADADVVDQARYLLSVWEAPRLRRPREWLTEIPDLSHLSEEGWNLTPMLPRKPSSRSHPTEIRSQSSDPAPGDRSDNGKMLWVLAIATGLALVLWGAMRIYL